ncbi:RNA-binding domain-containing protein [Ophiobolus disseminans]|uniref:RNA-binding domain-containing protein n=1 Tax=Ophiobolus disseminans TaxID=1469910 RepID=A0A6A6ZFU1_9PLEO|nr:RNA-binding domain-containing protein [Ophiobolus disseminans]
MQPHHSLPARPPPSNYSAPPSRPGNAGARVQGNSPMFAGFTPRSVVAQTPPQVGPSAVYSQAPVSAPYQAPAFSASNTYYDNSYSAYGAAAPAPSFPTAPPMNRAFGGGTYDPEEEARIAEWNSAYNKDDAAKRGNNANVGARTDAVATPDAEPTLTADGKRKTVVREGGGKSWEDATLLEWDPMHPRLFIGNLAGEVTDDSLHKAFSKYPSLVKSRVVRDKKSTKSKSYGFVSFSDTDDYFRAFKEMNGKYIGSHPVTIKRATSEVKAVTKKEDRHQSHGKNNKNNKGQTNRPNTLTAAAVAPNPVAFIPRGVQKKGKSGAPRVLG